jgi:hypothetical protein
MGEVSLVDVSKRFTLRVGGHVPIVKAPCSSLTVWTRPC